MWPAREANRVRPLSHPGADFGGDDHVLALDAEVTQRLPDLNFGLAFGIDVGCVDEIDARFERAGDELGGGGLIERADGAPEPAAAMKRHRPEADLGDVLAGAAERSIAHEGQSPLWKSPQDGPCEHGVGGRSSQARGHQPRNSRFREERRASRPAVLRRGEASLRRPPLRPAAPWRPSSSPRRPTSSPSWGRRPSGGGPDDGCEYGRRLRTHAACYAK